MGGDSLPSIRCRRYKAAALLGAALFLGSGAVLAGEMADKAPPPGVWDWSGFYIGAGGSFNSIHFDQSLQGVSGIINVFDGTVPIAKGQEGGPPFDFNRSKLGFAPEASVRNAGQPYPQGKPIGGHKYLRTEISTHTLKRCRAKLPSPVGSMPVRPPDTSESCNPRTKCFYADPRRAVPIRTPDVSLAE